MKIIITGADGFIGKNLKYYLSENTQFEIITFTRQNNLTELNDLVQTTDYIIHLAGVNRPKDDKSFGIDNLQLTSFICDAIRNCNKPVPLIFASSTQALLNNNYGQSKRAAEHLILALKKETGNETHILRLPNVFGKWSKPNYNSVVATFCHNIANDLPINIDEPDKKLELLHIDDLIQELVQLISGKHVGNTFIDIGATFELTVKELAESLYKFNDGRNNLHIETVGSGVMRALYSTFVSYLPKTRFKYPLPNHSDSRGDFIEIIKTPDAGQFSYFTSKPGVTRGGHYHHTKTEKFLVIRGIARFRFRNLITNETFSLESSEDFAEIVETVPGWIHDITNIGKKDLICLLWANEVFNSKIPDTYSAETI